MIKLARMRTLDECYDEIKRLDEHTALTKYYIRQLALNGKIPAIMVGRKRLINLDGLIEYISSGSAAAADTTTKSSGIRPIEERVHFVS